MKTLVVFALVTVLTSGARAQRQIFVVNSDTSTVKIKLKTTHELVDGTFHVQSGSIDFDPENPKLQGSVVVVAGSGKTSNDSRDKRMKKEILKVEEFATVSFEPKSYAGAIARSGDSTILVRLTRSPSPSLSISMAGPRLPRLISSFLMSSGA